MHRYSDKEKAFLKDNSKGYSYEKITQMFNQQFNTNLPISSVTATCFRYGCKNGIDCKFNQGYEPTQFKKGHVSFNKGTRGVMKANKTSFQKGQVPKNFRPVGSERTTVDGYIEVKVADPKKWRMKHIIIWEATNGPVPKGNVIIFADGNRQNLEIDNLILISRGELAMMNKHKFISDNAGLTKTGIIIADIYLKIGERKRKKGT